MQGLTGVCVLGDSGMCTVGGGVDAIAAATRRGVWGEPLDKRDANGGLCMLTAFDAMLLTVSASPR